MAKSVTPIHDALEELTAQKEQLGKEIEKLTSRLEKATEERAAREEQLTKVSAIVDALEKLKADQHE